MIPCFLEIRLKTEESRDFQVRWILVKLYNRVTFLKEINSPPRAKAGEEAPGFNIGKSFLRTVMSLRNINVTYSVREGTTLSGYSPRAFLMGMDSGFNAPGWGFILGSQDPDIRFRAADNDWLNKNPDLSSPFMQTYTTDLGLRASIEPAKDLKIQLDAKRTNNATYEELFRYSDEQTENNGFSSLTPPGKEVTISHLCLSVLHLTSGAPATRQKPSILLQKISRKSESDRPP